MLKISLFFLAFCLTINASSILQADETLQSEPSSSVEAIAPILIEASTPFSLAQLVELALEHHPATKRQWWQIQAAQARAEQAQGAYYPDLKFQASAVRGKDFQFISGPDTSYTTLSSDLVLSMMLYDFGERHHQLQGAKAALSAAHWQSNWTLQKVILEVLESAYQTLHSEEIAACAKLSFEDAERMLEVARSLNATGLASVSDLYLAEATRAQMQMSLLEAQAHRDLQLAKLASCCGLDSNSSFKISPIEQLPAPKSYQTQALIEQALKSRADLLAQKINVEGARAQVEKIKSSRWPKLHLSASTGASHTLHDETSGGRYRAGLSLDMPLFDGFKTSHQIHEAYAQAMSLEQDTLALEKQISLEVLHQVRLLQAFEEMLPQAESNLVNSQKAYDSVRERYLAGRVSIHELSSNLQLVASARKRHSELHIRWMVALSNLAYATGTLSPQTSFTGTP